MKKFFSIAPVFSVRGHGGPRAEADRLFVLAQALPLRRPEEQPEKPSGLSLFF
jgi:hypothetical protein